MQGNLSSGSLSSSSSSKKTSSDAEYLRRQYAGPSQAQLSKRDLKRKYSADKKAAEHALKAQYGDDKHRYKAEKQAMKDRHKMDRQQYKTEKHMVRDQKVADRKQSRRMLDDMKRRNPMMYEQEKKEAKLFRIVVMPL
jgi:hypothetical protein